MYVRTHDIGEYPRVVVGVGVGVTFKNVIFWKPKSATALSDPEIHTRLFFKNDRKHATATRTLYKIMLYILNLQTALKLA